MKVFLILILAISVYAGGISKQTYYTDCNNSEQSKFILECIKNANPKSDEEPEDWIYMCKNMSLDLYCTQKSFGRYWSNNMFSADINCACSKCKDKVAISACKQSGWIK